jgi:hypothetical protein
MLVGFVDNLQCEAPLRLATGDLFSLVGDPASLGGTISFINGLRSAEYLGPANTNISTAEDKLSGTASVRGNLIISEANENMLFGEADRNIIEWERLKNI